MSINTHITSRIRDQLGNADLERVSTMTFSILNTVSTHGDREPLPGEMVGAITAAFILTMEACQVPASDALGMARNIMADANGRRPEFKAITEYIKKEVLM